MSARPGDPVGGGARRAADGPRRTIAGGHAPTGPLDHLAVELQRQLSTRSVVWLIVVWLIVVVRLTGLSPRIFLFASLTRRAVAGLAQRALASRRGLQMLGQLIAASRPVQLVLHAIESLGLLDRISRTICS